jgi:metal-responsive CopG/Arc/MetJ family transcriptional regulator
MARKLITIALNEDIIRRLDQLVAADRFKSRGRMIEEAVRKNLTQRDPSRLAIQCAKLDARFEKALAELGMNTANR